MNNEPSYQSNNEIQISEIFFVILKYKLIILILPIVLALIAYVISQFLTPTYKSSTKLYIGNFGGTIYTNVESAQQILKSNDFLKIIMDDIDELSDIEINKFKNNINIKQLSNTMIEVEVAYHDPENAQKIANLIIAEFIEKSEVGFFEKKIIIEEAYESKLIHYNRISESLARNKEILSSIENKDDISNSEKDLTRARLIDYINADQNIINILETEIKEQQLKLLELEKAEVFETANIPITPSFPKPILNSGIAMIFGLFVTIFIAFCIEYFKKNPIKLREN